MGGLLGSLPTTPQHLRIHGGVVGVLLSSPGGGFGSGAGAVVSPDTAVFRLM